MSVTGVVLLGLGSALICSWGLSAFSVLAGIRRRERAAGVPQSTRTPLRKLLLTSLGLTLNVAAYSAARLWYKLRGKPLPPPPRRSPRRAKR